MLKIFVFIVNSHNKYQKNLLSLRTFNSVIINITKFLSVNSQNILKVQGFQAFGSLFFMQNFLAY